MGLQVGLKSSVFLPQLLECWNHRHMSPDGTRIALPQPNCSKELYTTLQTHQFSDVFQKPFQSGELAPKDSHSQFKLQFRDFHTARLRL